jgi:hypothetical protein
MYIKKIENSNALQRGELLVVAKLWKLSNSGLEFDPVQFYRHRRDPVPWVRRIKHRRLFRHPRTTNEWRTHFSNNATEEILEFHGVAFKLRQKRNWHMLPNSYDDLSIRYQRSWKENRGTQRKNAGSINRSIHSPPFWAFLKPVGVLSQDAYHE